MKSGWVIKKLGEVCKIQMGSSPDSASYNTERRGLPFYQGKSEFGLEHPSPVKWCDSPVRIAFRGDILLSVRAPIGPVNFANEKCCIGRGLASLRFEGEQRFLYYLLQSRAKELEAKGTGTTFKCISGAALKQFEIPVPPLAEQKRIVAEIDAAFEKIDKLKSNAERNLANAKELFQSTLDEAMRPKKCWMEKRLGDAFDLLNGYSFQSKNYVPEGIRVVRIANVQDGYIEDKSPCYYPCSKKNELARYMLCSGDLLMSLTGNVGRVGLLGDCMLPAALNQRVACLRPKDDLVLVKYAYYFLRQKSFVDACRQAAHGTAQPNLSTRWLSDYRIFVPSIREQYAIIEKLSRVSCSCALLEANYTRQIADCAEMRQSVLREAFEGRL